MRILFLSDFSAQGSGYINIAAPLCKGLHERGHEVIAIGLTYHGEPHNQPFTIIPCENFNEAIGMLQNLNILWPFDAFVVAMDIPIQMMILHESGKRGIKQIVITPLESDPLTFSWADGLSSAAKIFFISQSATDEAIKAGLENVEHLVVGLDTESWRKPVKDEKKKIRKTFAIPDDCFVVLTVADNQERKNLSKSFEIMRKFKKMGVKFKYIIVTREHQQVGWNLRDLSIQELVDTTGKVYLDLPSISSEMMIFERGISFEYLWMLYAASDAFLLTSKAEGLGMPILEAMAVGLPVAAINAGAIREHIGKDEKGWLIDYDYVLNDPFGNSNRYMADTDAGARKLFEIYSNPAEVSKRTKKARKYVENRNWEESVLKLEKAVEVIRENKDEK